MSGTERSPEGSLGAESLVSIVIPVLNGERHVGACLRSVLDQSYSHLEVIIADNASSDRTVEIVQSFGDARIRLLPPVEAQLNLHANWTRALKESRGEFVKVVPHDDLLHRECVASQVELLRQFPSAVLASSRRRIIDDADGVVIQSRGLGNLVARDAIRLVRGPAVAKACTRAGTNLLGEPASVLIRRRALPEPLFDPQWSYALDIEFYLRCLRDHDAVVDGHNLSDFRVSPRQLSATLGSRQALEMRAFLRQMTAVYPDDVSPFDVRLGEVRSQGIVLARRLLYGYLRVREALKRMRSR